MTASPAFVHRSLHILADEQTDQLARRGRRARQMLLVQLGQHLDELRTLRYQLECLLVSGVSWNSFPLSDRMGARAPRGHAPCIEPEDRRLIAMRVAYRVAA
jgi:hypothetical protein